jgi:predicted AlkP superfamily pyrophosphatase or phosphodiesterase
MNRLWIVLVAAATLLVRALPIGADGQTHLVILSIDGLMPASYARPGGTKTPVLRAMAAGGAWSEGVSGVVPTVTYASHTTLITGVRPAEHGITDNRYLDPEDRSDGGWQWYARDIRVPTIVGAVRSSGRTAAVVNWPVTVGMSADLIVPEFWRSNHPSDLSLLRALSTPNLLDAVEIARGTPFGWRQSDRERIDIAKHVIRTYHPALTLIHIADTDGAQHANGPGSPEAAASYERADALVGELRQTLTDAGLADRTYFAVVSDHGFLPTRHQLNPNAALKAQGLLTTNDAGRITDWKAYVLTSGGSGFVFLKDAGDRDTRTKVQQIVADLQKDPANGIDGTWSEADLQRLGGHPGAVLGIRMKPEYYLGGNLTRLLTTPGSKGGHGFDPAFPEMRSSFVVTGPGLQGVGNVGVVRMTQVAPTLAALIGVSISPSADHAIPAITSARR